MPPSLRAVEQCEKSGRGASIGDVAEYMAVDSLVGLLDRLVTDFERGVRA